MNIQSKSIITMALLFAMTSIAQGQGNNDGTTVVAVSPVLKIKPAPQDVGQSPKVPDKVPDKIEPPRNNPPANTNTNEPVVLKIWQTNGGGDWIGGDKWNKQGAFYESTNWVAPSKKSTQEKGYDLNFSGSSSRAQVGRQLGLLESSSLNVNGGASLDFKENVITYSGKAALIVDSSFLMGIGGTKPVDENASLELIVTNNAMVTGGDNPGKTCDFSGGVIYVKNSSCKISSIVRGKVTIDGYGSVEVSSNQKDVIKDSTINLSSAQSQFRFAGKTVNKVLSEDLDKFSISGAMPLYGNDPSTLEAGDNVLIRSDGGTGTIITVVK